MANGPYSRVYWTIVDDPAFERVFDNDHALAMWLRMLLVADAMWPATPPMPRRNPTLRLLIESSLVIQRPFNRYSLRGLDASREHRSAIGKHASAKRWQSERIANPMLREEKRREENGSIAQPTYAGSIEGSAPGSAVVPVHDGRHGSSCSVCAPLFLEKEGLRPEIGT